MNSSFFFAPKPRHPPFTTWGRCSIDSIPILTRTPPSAHQIPFLQLHPCILYELLPHATHHFFFFAIKPYHPFLALVKITTAWSICREHRMIDVVIRSWKIKYVVYYFLCQELINPLYFRTERGRSVSFGHGYLEHLSRITGLSNSDFE